MIVMTVIAHNIKAGDVFRRHGHDWTAEHVVRTWGSSVHVMCIGGGDVWIPQGESVTVSREARAS